jgi:glutamate formiminotransferase/glutamate formiminotransferase/formiminotetrahydrofolate cyclodeaminase
VRLVPLLAVPNVSEGRDHATLDAIGDAFERGGARLLDRHEDPDHHRAVFTLAGEPGSLAQAVVDGAREAIARIDLTRHTGEHPRVGAIDVAPIVFRDDADRGAACAEALVLADALGREGLPVYLYGALAGGRTRAELRRGGPQALIERTPPDYGPKRLHPTAGAVLVAAREPLVAFNVELAPPATLEEARTIAALIREGGAEGLPGVRAIGVQLAHAAQVSTNVEDHRAATPGDVLAAVRRHTPVAAAELVALAPEAALRDFPADIPLQGRATIEERLAAGPR